MGAALTLLARRDRSRRELRERLATRFPDANLEPLLDELTRLGYLDDRRLVTTRIFVVEAEPGPAPG
jgi:regulatory protein